MRFSRGVVDIEIGDYYTIKRDGLHYAYRLVGIVEGTDPPLLRIFSYSIDREVVLDADAAGLKMTEDSPTEAK